MGPVFKVQVEFQVTGLRDEVDVTVLVAVASRAEAPDAPSAHAVGTAGEVAFLEGQYGAVAIRIGDAEAHVEHELAIVVRQDLPGKVHIALHILGVGDIEHTVMPFAVALRPEHFAAETEQVARRLDIRLDGYRPVVVAVAKAGLHNKQVLVVIAQDGIVVAGIIEILLLESVADPGHKHIVQVDEVELVLVVVALRLPTVMPSCGEHLAVELGTVLCVVKQRHLTGGDGTATHIAAQEGHDEAREAEAALHAVLDEVLIAVSFQSLDGLVGTTELHAESLGAPEQVTVLIGERCGSPQVAGSIGALGLKTDCGRFVGLQLDVGVEQGTVRILLETDVRVAHGIDGAGGSQSPAGRHYRR